MRYMNISKLTDELIEEVKKINSSTKTAVDKDSPVSEEKALPEEGKEKEQKKEAPVTEKKEIPATEGKKAYEVEIASQLRKVAHIMREELKRAEEISYDDILEYIERYQ